MSGDNYAVFQEFDPFSCLSAQDPTVNMISTTQEIADISYGSSSSSHNFACKDFLGPDRDWPSTAQAEGSLTQEHKEDMERTKTGDGYAITFRTLSEFENLDDGYKWRKYGKKMLKTSTQPRNYYKCSNEGCKVKKRVERDDEDHRYVLTTYEGIHNHPRPSPLYSCDTLLIGWTSQPSSHTLI
ncbi:hypothetical protein CDL12_26547 [Handroanthus impetiginosus]|uniref:WRKY domain-containing protein n=1 Tax=Handroanthus impetiginosus TaxID=429701 RepID=A0A2G9G726_9LAMI|nr:hypothetical protein CDL12_26547 [Handroanthus impetiginosus]